MSISFSGAALADYLEMGFGSWIEILVM